MIKPCISGTVQKTSGALATLGFAIFYMIINIGSLFGRGTAFVVRTRLGDVVLVLGVVGICALAAAAPDAPRLAGTSCTGEEQGQRSAADDGRRPR